MSKRRARPASRVSRPVGQPAPRRRSSRQPLVVLALVFVTVALLGVIAVVALSNSSHTNSANPATPAVTPGTPAPTPITGPVPGIGILSAPTSAAPVASASPKVGSKAPNFSWRTTKGLTSLAALRGHPVLLEFYGVWCNACQGDVPLLNSLQKTYGPRGLQVLSVTGSPYCINYESNGDTSPVSMYDLFRYKQTFRVTYQQVLDQGTRVFNMYGRGSVFPTFYVIDRKGIVRFGISSGISNQNLTAQVRAAL
jgi:thiol-disulfide isomerase/thioredoxin